MKDSPGWTGGSRGFSKDSRNEPGDGVDRDTVIRPDLIDQVIRPTIPEKFADDEEYVQQVYDEIEGTIQDGMNELAKKRKFPVFA